MTQTSKMGMKSAVHGIGVLGGLLLLAACGGGGGGGIACTDDCPILYSLGGSVSGLVCCTQLILQDGLNSEYPGTGVGANGTGLVWFGASANEHYDVIVASQPTNPSQTCVVANGTGTVGSSSVTDIMVTCTINPPRFVYATNAGSNSVSAFAVDAVSGSLMPIAGSPFAAGGDPIALAVDPTGSYAVVANHSDATVSAFLIDRSSGALTAVKGSPFATGAGPTSVAIDPSSSFLYVTSGSTGALFAYTINRSTGALSAIAGSPYAVGSLPTGVTVDPILNLVYVANEGDNTLSTFTADLSGVLTAVSGSPIATGGGPCAISADPSGQFIFVTNCAANVASSYNNLLPAPGDLTAINTVSGGTDPVSIAIDPISMVTDPFANSTEDVAYFLYVANKGSNEIAGYSIINRVGGPGYLLALQSSPYPAGTAPSSIAVDPTGRFAFVANSGSGTIGVYSIDETSGALSERAGSPYVTGDLPSALAISD